MDQAPILDPFSVAQPLRGGSSRVAERLGYIKSFGPSGFLAVVAWVVYGQ